MDFTDFNLSMCSVRSILRILTHDIEMLDLSKPRFTHVMPLVSAMVLKLGDGSVG